MSLRGNVPRVISKGNYTKTTRDRSVKISEDHPRCIENLILGIEFLSTSARNLWLKGFRAVTGPKLQFFEKERSVFQRFLSISE